MNKVSLILIFILLIFYVRQCRFKESMNNISIDSILPGLKFVDTSTGFRERINRINNNCSNRDL